MGTKIPVLSVYDEAGNRIPIPAIRGKSAYAYAQDGGYTGTEEDFAKKLAQDVPEGGGSGGDYGGDWRLLRTIIVPEDIANDNSGIEWFACDLEGYTHQPFGFYFNTDENGKPFAVKELRIIGKSLKSNLDSNTVSIENFYNNSNNIPGEYSISTVGDRNTLKTTEGDAVWEVRTANGFSTSSCVRDKNGWHHNRRMKKEKIDELTIRTYKNCCFLYGSELYVYGR